MNITMKTILAATAVSLGLAAMPASAQVLGGTRAPGYTDRTTGYTDDGRLNVFGARIDPPAARGPGLIGGVVGGVVGGATGAVGNVVGGVAGGTAAAVDDVTTGSLGYRGGAAYGPRTAY